MTYVAFLRGINVGGNALIKMADLRQTFESEGFQAVEPVLASGNVIFEADVSEPGPVKNQIEMALKKRFKIEVLAFVRNELQMKKLIQSNPVQNSKLSPQMKLQVTFLAQATASKGRFPVRLASDEFQLIQASANEIFSMIDLSTDARTPELMQLLEKRFGKDITTRTWNTIEKIGRLLAARSEHREN